MSADPEGAGTVTVRAVCPRCKGAKYVPVPAWQTKVACFACLVDDAPTGRVPVQLDAAAVRDVVAGVVERADDLAIANMTYALRAARWASATYATVEMVARKCRPVVLAALCPPEAPNGD